MDYDGYPDEHDGDDWAYHCEQWCTLPNRLRDAILALQEALEEIERSRERIIEYEQQIYKRKYNFDGTLRGETK